MTTEGENDTTTITTTTQTTEPEVSETKVDVVEQNDEDKDIEELKKQVELMQQEALRLEYIQKEVSLAQAPFEGTQTSLTEGGQAATAAAPAGYNGYSDGSNLPQSKSVDVRSVYIGNVDYSSTPEELQTLFQSCGLIKRVTILCDKFTGHPKGYAYIEFAEEESVNNAMSLDGSFFHQRQIKVNPKRTNLPGVTAGAVPPRGRGRGRGNSPAGGRAYGRGQVVQPYYYQPYPYPYY
eukprot:TRINITY_DN7161_c0_g1_i1.p1 TRINITY_DN7161_c0_g1~~TRINITY_DN7161_c0_g1_i1.p1  ORF type:complete len:237 (+),score=69.47 TRINITY_DN7161_c0_g1_i1:66-776(+)